MKHKRTGWFCLLFGLAMLAAVAGCGDEDHVNIFHATFQADGQSRDFTTIVGFMNTLGDEYDIGYNLDRDHLETNGLLLIDLPPDVKAGNIYSEADRHVLLLYEAPDGTRYRSDYGDTTLTLTMIDWPGPGGYAHGTFEATLQEEGSLSQIQITEGAFEGFIHN